MPSAPPIHPDDEMFHGSMQHYDSVGNQMAGFAEHASTLSDAIDPKVLDLPCGYGRVTRKLVEKFGAANIWAGEIMAPAVDFCVETFGVNGIYVSEPAHEFRNIESDFYDVAVMGSLLTHLSDEHARAVIKHFVSKVRKGGVAVITTHGSRARWHMGNSTSSQIDELTRARLLSTYDQGKYSFEKYRKDQTLEAKTSEYIGETYGVSLIPDSWMHEVCTENGFVIVEHRVGGWDDNQDVFFIKR